MTNFLLARRGHQGDEEISVYRYSLTGVRPDGHGNAQMRHTGRPPYARDSRTQRAVAERFLPSRSPLAASVPGVCETPVAIADTYKQTV